MRALEALLIIQADHEQNASTSAMRLVGSTRANPYACTAAAIAALWGPLHGGANEAVLQTLAEIGTVDRIPEMLRRAKDKNDPFRLMGFGHRVYKSYDPRAKVLRRCCHEVLDALGQRDDPLLELAMELERDRPRGRILHRAQALSQCRFLFRHHLPRAGPAAGDVHAGLRGGAHRRLGGALERDDRRPGDPHRPSAPALHRAAERAVVPIAERRKRTSRSSVELPGRLTVGS